MNGPARKIEILAPFNQAIELTRSILFCPFDITKWLVIGFAAFLSGWLNSGGGSINPWSFRGWNTSNAQPPTFQFRSFHIDHAGMFILVLVAVLVIVFLTFLILWLWITARGRFIFIDCIVRNRAAITEPWREFRREGNRFFLFLIVALLIGWLMVGCLVTCLTCCLASLPYIGTVIVLPVPVFFRSFSLLFLRQFGPDWDVWKKIPVPETTAPPPVQTIVPAPSPAPTVPTQDTTPTAPEIPPQEPNHPERSPYEPPESPPP